MTLMLDGQKVEGINLKLTANMGIESDDLSGQTSGTESAHKGFKPKTLAAAMSIRYIDSTQLRDLMRLAEATESGGQRKTYRIVNETAAAFGVRQVQFSESVSAREDDSLHLWRIGFTLTEKLSNPERVEKRRDGSSTNQQAAPGAAVGGTDSAGAGDGSSTATELTGFEKLLKNVDDYIGGAQ